MFWWRAKRPSFRQPHRRNARANAPESTAGALPEEATTSQRRKLLAATICLAWVGGGVLLLSPSQRTPNLHLKIVAQGVEEGKLVVFFRVEGAPETNSVLFSQAFKEVPTGLLRPGLAPWEFWAPSQKTYPVGAYGDKVFGVTAPTNAGVWKLRLEMLVMHRDSARKVREIGNILTLVAREPIADVLEMVRAEWHLDEYQDQEILESDPITNSVGFAEFTK